MKYFVDEINKFYNKLVNKEHFSLVRYNDGEWYILSKKFIDITNKCNGEWKYDPENISDNYFRDELINSLQYKDDSYYVGIMTDCSCYKKFKHGGFKLIYDLAQQDDEHLTFASIFMNYNYYYIVKPKIVPFLYNVDKVLVVNHGADISKIPNVSKVFRVGINSWINDFDIIPEIVEYTKMVNDKYFIICAGPLSNMIIHKTHMINKKNTYINFGSGFDSIMFSEHTRWYQYNEFLKTHCCWWNENLSENS